MIVRFIDTPIGAGLRLASGEDDSDKARPQLAPGEGRAPAKGTVLVVEDDYFSATAAADALTHGGYTVVGTAATAVEAVELAVRHRPQIILMDIRLAGPSDGIEAAITILQKTGIRSIFATAHVDAATRARAMVAQPAGWLPKPYNGSDIVAAVAAALLGRQ